MRRLLSYLILLLSVWACARTLEVDTSGGFDASLEGKPVTVTFSIPDIRITPSTKAVQGDIASDPYLDPDKLYVVVCGGNQSIKYIRKAEIVLDDQTHQPIIEEVSANDIQDYPLEDHTTTVQMYKFTVQLELTDSRRAVYFLGNINEDQLVTGSYAYQVFPSILSYDNEQAYWQRVNMPPVHAKPGKDGKPMMTENGSYVPSDEVVASLRHIPLIRNYAKIQVTDATAPEDGFELYSYAVIYYPKRGTVVPYRSNVADIKDAFNFNALGDDYRFSGYERCTFQELDQVLEYPGYLSPTAEFDYEIPDASMFEKPETSGGRVIRYDKNNTDQGVYLYERSIPNDYLDPTYVIIRGKFGEEGKYYYYRLDLMETKTVNNESVYQYYPIYRNFRYNIQLNRISSIGVDTPEAAAKSSGAEDISADISMKYLADISNGKTRLVVEPFMSKTYTGPNEEGYYYLYARFFNDLNSSEPNVDWGAVSVELEPMSDQGEDILVLYDDVGNEVHAFYPGAQSMGGEPGFRIIRFNTKTPGSETKTQKIKITGRNLYTHEEFPLYREVEISLQKKQTMVVSCGIPELPLQKGASQVVNVSIPSGLPSSMFPLEFTMEAERLTLTPDSQVTGNNLPVYSGLSISDNEAYAGKQTIQFIRTLTLDEYKSLPVTDGKVTFSSYFKSNTSVSATTIWVANDYFIKGSASFGNVEGLTGHFYVQADYDNLEGCVVIINMDKLEYNYDEEGWQTYTKNTVLKIPRGHKVYFRSTTTTQGMTGDKFYCCSPNSEQSARDGKFSIGGNIASLLVGDNFAALGSTLTNWSFQNCFKGHVNLTDASELIMPMLTCASNSCKNMFSGCTSLAAIPYLPATTLATSCYESMFEGCSALAVLPSDFVLPAGAPGNSGTPVGSLATNCYKTMFRKTGLITAPALDATTLAESCYYGMFSGCTSLSTSTSPIFLPASTLVTNCYREMFYGDSGVNAVICLATDKSASNCTTNWLNGVAEYGTFWKASGVTWGTGVSAIPTKWVPMDYGVPLFPGNPPFDEEIDL